MRSACLLALTGGGIMARFTTEVLEILERQRHSLTGKSGTYAPLCQAFDLMAGTSAGALCVAGLAVGRSPAELSALLDAHGPRIFPGATRWRKLRWVLTAKYAAKPLHDAVDDALQGANPRLGDLPCKVAFPAVDERLGQPVVFTNADPAHLHLRLRDVVLASAAAPTYFPAHRIADLGRRFVDGGMFANAPDLAAVTLARRIWPHLGIEDLHLISIGTTKAPSHSPYEDDHPGAKGLFAWATKPPARILKLAMHGQVDHAMDLLSQLQLGDFIRIDAVLKEAEDLGIELDNAAPTALDALTRAGSEAVERLSVETASRLSAAFERAMAAAPCVLFLEELDGFGSRDDGERSNNSYRRAVITHLLQQIDAVRAVPGVLLVGCTNHLDAIDPAVRRAGRFDLTLRIGLPDRAALLAILRDLLPEAGFDIGPAADRLIGRTGADAAASVREALSRARDADEALSAAHLDAALDRIAPRLAPEIMRRAAAHEAGHVLVAHLIGMPAVQRAILSPTGGQVDLPLPPLDTFATAHARLRVILAGRAAEIVAHGEASSGAGNGADSDLAQATGLVLRTELQWGFGDCGLVHAPLPDATRIPAWLHAKLRGVLAEAQDDAITLLRADRAALDRIATALLAKRDLDAAAIAALLPPPDEARTVAATANENVIPFPEMHASDRPLSQETPA